MNRRLRTAAFALAALLVAVGIAAMAGKHTERDGSFKAFYCAGRALAQGADPYRAAPLQRCEEAAVGDRLDQGEVEPAPLPGYALAPWAALGGLSFRDAALFYDVLALAATLATALILAALTGLPAAGILLVLAPLALLNIAYGELPVFTTFGIALAGYGLRKERAWLCGLGAAIALVQPHIGGAVLLGMFALAPRSRPALLFTAAALAALSLLTTGLSGNLEYFVRVLPVQAASELPAADQYSLSHLLYTAGVPARTALAAADASTLIMLIAGILGARYAAARLRAPEFYAFLPAAAVLLFGLYLHDIQFIAALPAATAAAAFIEPARRTAAGLALMALAVVWSQAPGRAVLAINLAAAIAAAAMALPGSMTRRILGGALLGCIACVIIVALHGPGAAHAATVPRIAPGELAATAWANYLRDTPDRVTETLQTTLLKIPSWLGIATLLIACAAPPLTARSRTTVASQSTAR